MIVPTRTFWIWLALGILLALVGLLVPGFERFLVPYNLILFGLMLGSSFFARRGVELTCQRKMDPLLSNRVLNRIEILIRNEGDHSVGFRLRDAAPEKFGVEGNEFDANLDPGDEVELAYHVRPSRRGEEVFEDPFVRIRAPLGLCEVEHRLSAAQTVHVYPNVLALREFDLLKQRGRLAMAGSRKARLKGQGTEFESLRDYDNDSFRKIDWKSSARRGKLMVREYTTERNQQVLVCIDTGRSMLSEIDGVSKLDSALDSCLLLLHAAANAGDLTGLMVFDKSVQKLILPRRGRSQAGILLNAIHDLEAKPVESNYIGAFAHLAARQKRRSLIIVFTDVEDAAHAQKLAKALAPLRKRHLVFVARVMDPNVAERVNMEIVKDGDLYLKAAGLWYDTERRRGTAHLTASKIENIEAEPKDLAAALVGAYLIAKERIAL